MRNFSASRVASRWFQAQSQDCYYDGPPLESGGTSITGRAVPYIRALIGSLPEGSRILDYGAGKMARNADFLRAAGYKVFQR